MVQANAWEAHRAELAPLTANHTELVDLYEADRAKLAEMEKDAQGVVDEAALLNAELERCTHDLTEVWVEAYTRMSDLDAPG